uniref:Uncharacterized protein n=1 Tax=Oryza rufipogon TaxID=4529 RepID=A0A0E0RGW1_ORYRU
MALPCRNVRPCPALRRRCRWRAARAPPQTPCPPPCRPRAVPAALGRAQPCPGCCLPFGWR